MNAIAPSLGDETLEQVTGGSIVYGSDGNAHTETTRYATACGNYRCKRCGSSVENHIARCRLAENQRDLCGGCAYFESLKSDADGFGCCRFN